MWTTLALLATLGSVAADSGELTLKNIRATYGFLGAQRHDNQLLPGDSYFLAFDIEGLSVEEDGKIKYSMAMEVTDSKNKVIYARDPNALEAYNSLGGTRTEGMTYVDVGFNQPPGEYTVNLTVTDSKTKAAQSFKRKFEVLPKSFGLARFMTSYDGAGRIPAPSSGVVGQFLYVNFAAIGFEKNAKREPDVRLQMRVLDESGKATVEKPLVGDTRREEVGENIVAIPMSFALALNRPGKFTIELEGTDRLGKKTAKLSIPLIVTEQK